ncbi:HK97 gp10 family phage protein [Enterovirga rhinocerotis]|uniref:HK97 gp10 family phage protein n=1 Tax=Enterovirga rhinocerotis TaxID=1339210 RepID=UPI00105D63BA|nr:HK97 gp10 family phage protein [Enterovirga rhinocerotis]
MNLFDLARLAYSATVSSTAVVDQLGRMAVKLVLSSSAVDVETARRLVDAMKDDAPQRTGALREGITSRTEGNQTIVEASAERDAWDYAPFVESGTEFMSAEPFFYDNADRILGERAERMDDVAGSL